MRHQPMSQRLAERPLSKTRALDAARRIGSSRHHRPWSNAHPLYIHCCWGCSQGYGTYRSAIRVRSGSPLPRHSQRTGNNRPTCANIPKGQVRSRALRSRGVDERVRSEKYLESACGIFADLNSQSYPVLFISFSAPELPICQLVACC